MIDDAPNLNALWCDLLVEELVRQGVRCFCLSSGARSGPLAAAVARHPAVTPKLHFDERASAFYALGHARATGVPSVWITTSGTAVANGAPAVVEAAQDGVPLILLTADRPPELRDTRANQTMDQVRFFAPHTRWDVDLPCPDPALPAAYVLTTVDQAVARAQHGWPGPVHINCMFREPLAPVPDGGAYSAYLEPVAAWRASDAPYTRIGRCERVPSEATLTEWAERIAQAENGCVLLGRPASLEQAAWLPRLLERLPWPVLPDVLSGLRLGAAADPQLIPFGDQVLLAPEQVPSPDLVLTVGGPLVSKRVQAWAESLDAVRAVVRPHPHRQDPGHDVTCALECDLSGLVIALERAGVQGRPARGLADWQRASRRVADALQALEPEGTAVDEIFVAMELSRRLVAGQGLFVGNSMPIRDLDLYAAADGERVPVAANRGVSGIDGTLATACGWAAGLDRPVTVVLGDLSLLHDLTALHYVRASARPVTVLVVNNNGGGIFSFLPVAAFGELFEPLFGTPHGMTFEAAARQFDLPYTHAATRAELSAALEQAGRGEGSRLIEVRTDRTANALLHRTLQGHLCAALKEV